MSIFADPAIRIFGALAYTCLSTSMAFLPDVDAADISRIPRAALIVFILLATKNYAVMLTVPKKLIIQLHQSSD